MMRKILAIGTVLLLAACGTVATPRYEAPTPEHAAMHDTVTAQPAHIENTAVPSTATPLLPTEAPTSAPTEVPTEVPTQAPTVDPMKSFVDLASASDGEQLFHEFDFVTGDDVAWRCTTCHNTEDDIVRIGPSMAGLAGRAGTRVEGQSAYTYIYHSIRNPAAFVPEGFEDSTKMPEFANLSDADIYDLIAYLMTLN